MLLSVLVLPLTIPLLIFATAAMDAASMHLPVKGTWRFWVRCWSAAPR
ncbi:heme exporter protein CcmB [Shigella flexneri]